MNKWKSRCEDEICHVLMTAISAMESSLLNSNDILTDYRYIFSRFPHAIYFQLFYLSTRILLLWWQIP